MTEQTRNDATNDETPVENEGITDTAEKAEQEADTPTDSAKTKKEQKKEAKEVKAELVSLRRELSEAKTALEAAKQSEADAKDRYLRVAAEYDNFRRRTAKERESLYTDAVADVLRDLLPLADNLERAADSKGDAESIAQGLRMTLTSFTDLLKKQDVEAFGAVGDTFDPTIHNAVMHEEDESKNEGEVTDVFQKGYRRGDKILRYAMVKTVN